MSPHASIRPAVFAALMTIATFAHAAVGPGLDNRDWGAEGKNVWDAVADFTSSTGTPRGHGNVTMFRGYLVVIFSSDGGGGKGNGGFALFDVSDLSSGAKLVFTTHNNPNYDSSSDHDATNIREAHGIAFRGDVMVLGTNGGSGDEATGLQFWDLSTPTSDPDGNDPDNATGPQRLAHLRLPGLNGGDYSETPWWLSWQGRWLYASCAGDGLYIIDALDPSNPVIADRGGDPNPIPTSELGDFRFNQVLTVGNLMVGSNADLNNGIMLADISDPLHPQVEWSTKAEDVGYSFMVNGDRLLGAADPALIWDISDWSNVPAPITADNIGSRGGYGTAQDGIFHFGTSNGVGKVRISDGADQGWTKPKRVNGDDIGGADWDFNVVVGNLSFAGNDHSSGSALLIHDLDPDTTPPAANMVVPKDGSSGQALTSRIGLTFTDMVLVESINSSTLAIRPQGGSALTGHYAVGTGIVNFTPADDLLPGTTYEIVVAADGISDLAGNTTAGEQVFTFTTAGTPADPLTIDLPSPGAEPIGTQVVFDAAPNGGDGGNEYRWDFGDGTVLDYGDDDDRVRHTYAEPGHYSVTVRVRDASGTTASDSIGHTAHRPLTAGEPRHSNSIATDASGDSWFVVNPDNDSIAAVDASGTPDKSWGKRVGAHPTGIARDGEGLLWVVSADDDRITIIDPATQGSETMTLPRGSEAQAILFDSSGDTAYVTLRFSDAEADRSVGQLLKIDRASRSIVDELVLGPYPHAMAITHDDSRILVTRFISPTDHAEIYDIDAGSFSLSGTIDLAMDPGLGGSEPDNEADARGVLNYLHRIVISPDGTRAWVSAKKDNVQRGTGPDSDGRELTFETTVRTVLAPIDLSSDSDLVDERIDLNDRDNAYGIAFSPLGNYLFVSVQGSRLVEIIDAYSGTGVGAITDLGFAPQGIHLTDDGQLGTHAFLSRELSLVDVSDLLATGNGSLPDPEVVDLVDNEDLPADVFHGKQIFYTAIDERMSRDGYISCASCHIDGGADERVWDFTQRGEGVRNTVTLRGRAGAERGAVHWTGNFDEIHDFENDIRNEFGGSGFLSNRDFNDTRDPLGDEKAGHSADLDDLAAYVTSLDSVGKSPYRRNNGNLTNAGQAGRTAFEKANCMQCHQGPHFSDSHLARRHDVGTITAASGSRIGETLDGFDTPELTGLWRTAPYLHDGSAATLADVLDNDQHGDPERLSEQEKADLVAYLLQLDDDADPAPNNPPVITAIAATQGQLSATAEDLDADELSVTWSVLSKPDGATVVITDTAALTTNLNVDTIGDYSFQLVISDGIESDSATTSLQVDRIIARRITMDLIGEDGGVRWLLDEDSPTVDPAVFDTNAASDHRLRPEQLITNQ